MLQQYRLRMLKYSYRIINPPHSFAYQPILISLLRRKADHNDKFSGELIWCSVVYSQELRKVGRKK